MDKYLLTPGFYSGRARLPDIRMGTNPLQIEKGRWERKPEALRVCLQCDMGVVENEFHFTVECPKYVVIRKYLFDFVYNLSGRKWVVDSFCKNDQFLFLVNGSGDSFENQIYSAFQRFLLKAFKIRQVL